jgi:hypothetical protein
MIKNLPKGGEKLTNRKMEKTKDELMLLYENYNKINFNEEKAGLWKHYEAKYYPFNEFCHELIYNEEFNKKWGNLDNNDNTNNT